MYIYILAYASVTIHNTVHLFNINSRKMDGHHPSWIEYLNERYNINIFDRSIKWDNKLS